ncbi:hypothetical protein CLPUN_34010 [Clostridium puniceum]|uniref:Uncharacterized protein n=1 Tax=Clostridium puniceum TaxID=29367 RepID=A0A1S8TCE1_9CLOT|nr:hypothetical protein CLPUN_34010 [Clostridium puniceum]
MSEYLSDCMEHEIKLKLREELKRLIKLIKRNMKTE